MAREQRPPLWSVRPRGVQQVSPRPGWWDRARAPTAISASAKAVWPPPPFRDPQGTSPFCLLGRGASPTPGSFSLSGSGSQFTVHEDLSCTWTFTSPFPGGEIEGPISLEREERVKGKPFGQEYKVFRIWELLKQLKQTSKVETLLEWMTVISGGGSGVNRLDLNLVWKWCDLGSEAPSQPRLVLPSTQAGHLIKPFTSSPICS